MWIATMVPGSGSHSKPVETVIVRSLVFRDGRTGVVSPRSLDVTRAMATIQGTCFAIRQCGPI